MNSFQIKQPVPMPAWAVNFFFVNDQEYLDRNRGRSSEMGAFVSIS